MKPRLVLVHGSLSAAEQWNGYAELLPDFEVVTPDLPGHGSRAEEAFTLTSAWETIDRAVLGAEPGQPVFLVGHSLGGYLAMVAAAAHPERLAGLALLGATGDPTGKLSGVYRGFGWVAERFSKPLMAVREGISDRMSVPRSRVPDNLDYGVMAETWRVVIDNIRPEMLASVTKPVLILNGQYDQMRVAEKRFAALAPQAQIVTIPKATHLAPLTHAEVVAEALQSWLVDVLTGDPLS